MYLLTKRLKFSSIGYIVTHTLFFYSIQSVARFTHTNIIYVYFLIPLCLYFIEEFLSEKRTRCIVFLALTNVAGIYYGNYNAVAISALVQGIYLVCSLNLIKNYKLLAKFTLILILWIFSLSLPTLITSGVLYTTSTRNAGALSFAQGSVSPLYLITNLVYPYPLGLSDSYIGGTIKNSWLFHEESVYPGIAALILAVTGYLLLNNIRLKKFLLINTALFILFSCIGYFPFFRIFNFFPINIFRYWIRYTIAFHLSIALMVGYFISNAQTIPPINLKKIASNILSLIPVFLMLIYLFTVNAKAYSTLTVLKYLQSAFPSGFIYKKEWLAFLILASIFTLIFIAIRKRYLLYAAGIIATVDILFFSYLASVSTIEPKRTLINDSIYTTSKQLSKQRVLYLDKQIKGNTPLYYETWGLFGYSVSFEQKNYDDYLTSLGLESRRFKESNPKALSPLGVTAYIYPDGTHKDFVAEKVFIPNVTEYIIKDEGHIIAQLYSPKPTQVHTLIRNFPGWKVIVDGKSTDILSSKNDVYLSFNLDKTNSIVEIKYVPIHLYYGIAFGLIMLGVTLCVTHIKRF